jgi:hypothetical protein
MVEQWEDEGGAAQLPAKWNVPFDKQIIKWVRDAVDDHADDPYGRVPTYINWLWLSQMVAAAEKGLEQ